MKLNLFKLYFQNKQLMNTYMRNKMIQKCFVHYKIQHLEDESGG